MPDTIFSQYKGGRRGPWPHREFQMTTRAGKKTAHGSFQYDFTSEELRTFDQPEDVVNDPPDWIIGEISTDNLERLTPQTKTGKANPWELVAVIKKCNHTGEIIAIKGALKNVVRPNEYALMTAFHPTEAEQYNFRTLKTPSKGGWSITQCRMIAPYIFWNALKLAADSVETTESDGYSTPDELESDEEQDPKLTEQGIQHKILPDGKYTLYNPKTKRWIGNDAGNRKRICRVNNELA